jgi:hypothetical protein
MRGSWLAILLLLDACTGPGRSVNVYESKTGETAGLAVDAARQGRAAPRLSGVFAMRSAVIAVQPAL